MKKLYLLSVFVTFSLCSAFVNAGGALGYNNITSVSFQGVGFFLTADSWENPNSCTKSNSVVLLNTDVNYDKAYALLLAAYMSGKQVAGYSDGCADHDGQTYNKIRGFKYLTVK